MRDDDGVAFFFASPRHFDFWDCEIETSYKKRDCKTHITALKTRLRDLWNSTKILRDPEFLKDHSPPLFLKPVVERVDGKILWINPLDTSLGLRNIDPMDVDATATMQQQQPSECSVRLSFLAVLEWTRDQLQSVMWTEIFRFVSDNMKSD